MTINKGDFIEIDYTGTIKETNEVFDTTNEHVAKQHNIYSAQTLYKPIIICVGEGMILRGLDTHIQGKELGTYTIELTQTEAFGIKDPKNIQMIPAKKFKEQHIQPYPGLRLNIDGMIGIIKTAGGGRILVDFNHPIAGKTVIYTIEIKRVVTEHNEKINAILTILFNLKSEQITTTEEVATITLSKELPTQITDIITNKIIATCCIKSVTWKIP